MLDASASDIVYWYLAPRICKLLENRGGSASSGNFDLNSSIGIEEFFFTKLTLTNRHNPEPLKLGESACFRVAANLNCISGKSSVRTGLTPVFRFGIC